MGRRWGRKVSVADKASWDPALYERFKMERAQPFHDLLARVPEIPVRLAADLGCGTGELTRALLDRWPGAEIIGVDNSTEMLAKGSRHPRTGLTLVHADLREWRPPRPIDLVFSNAALHWVPDHATLLARLAGMLAPGGVVAVQVPNNRGEAAYAILDRILSSPAWKGRVPADGTRVTVEAPAWYLARLRELGLEPEVWETIYYHRLPDAAALVGWLAGSTLRPVLTGLAPGEEADLLEELRSGIAEAYAPGPAGLVFPFRRLFFVAGRPPAGHP